MSNRISQVIWRNALTDPPSEDVAGDTILLRVCLRSDTGDILDTATAIGWNDADDWRALAYFDELAAIPLEKGEVLEWAELPE